MRRPLINTKSSVNINLSTSTSQRTTVVSGVSLEKTLRHKRSQTYVEAMTKLDAGGVNISNTQKESLIQAIQSEFPDLQPYQYPIGLISKCYLGHPYEVHTLDVNFDIIKHYKIGEALPTEMERGRSLALHPGYEFIEIYNDSLIAVKMNGDVAIIKG